MYVHFGSKISAEVTTETHFQQSIVTFFTKNPQKQRRKSQKVAQ